MRRLDRPNREDVVIAADIETIEPEPAAASEDLAGWAYPGLDYPTFRLVLVAKAIDRLTLRWLAEHSGLTASEWRVLSRLAPRASATVGQIAEMAWVDRAEVSRAAYALEQRGLTSRRPNPRDRRSPMLFCTDAGRAEYERLIGPRAAFHRSLANDLDGAEEAALDALLVKIARRLARLSNEPE